MLDSSGTEAPAHTAAESRPQWPWLATAAMAVAVGVTYYLVAHVSLNLLMTPRGMAAYWPAAGVATGVVLALGPAARVPIAIAVAFASFLSGTVGYPNSPLALAAVFALCNASLPLLIAWLVERPRRSAGFDFDSVPRVLRFLLATGLAAAVAALVATTGVFLLHNPPAPYPTFWLYWLLSDAVGVLVVAPLVVGIARSTHNPLRTSELVEGACILGVLALMSLLGFAGPTDRWFTILPFAMILPLLLWPAARCPPVLAAAAIFVLALVIIASAIIGVGHIGAADISMAHRLLAAQSALITISTCTLVIAALFAERRSREALLSSSNAQLRSQKEAFRRLLGSLPAAIYTTDTTGHLTYCNQAAIDLWGRRPQLGRDKWFDLWQLHYPDGSSVPLSDRPTKIALSEGRAVRGREALLERPDGTLVPIMPCPAPMLDERGKTIGVVNMQIDLTERKEAEAALAERDTFLDLASKAARVGTYTVDLARRTVRLSPGLAVLYGLPEGITELSRADARARVHPEDLAGLDEGMRQAWQERREEHVAEFRVVRADDGEVCWIELRSLISYDGDQARRLVGVGIDVTAHKRAEEHQRLLVAELDHRVKNVLATVSAVASRTQDASRSGDDFAAALAGRIRSMAATHELLSGRQWKGVSVRALVHRVLAPYMTPVNTEIDGPDAILRPEAGQAVSMVLHELATNAAKHGALSTEGGRVSVSWKRMDGEIRVVWQEGGGPSVQPTQRAGYGTEVIRGLIPYELGGAVELAFEPEGVRCVLVIPAAEKKRPGKSQDRDEAPPSIEAVGDLI